MLGDMKFISRVDKDISLIRLAHHTKTFDLFLTPFLMCVSRAVARALIGGGGGGGGGCLFIYSCSARLISFEINLKTTDFKRNPSAITRIYEYTPPSQLTL